jgi:predicted MPP superfamily phosphohydrolase
VRLSARLAGTWQRKWTRREVLKLSAASVAAIGLGGLSYGFAVRDHVVVSRFTVGIANLPAGFDGLTIAQLSDIHHGPYTGLDYIRRCVEITNSLKPDVIALTGDFTFAGKKHVAPCAEALRELKARVGVYAVLGNHDYYAGASHVAHALKKAGCNVLIDALDALESRGDKLWLAGVDDLYYGSTNPKHLLRDVPREAAKIVLAHNPDFIEEFAARSQPIDLMIAGHTHGGQIRLPLLGAPQISSEYGQRYAIGMNRKGTMQVYTTRGIGTILLPTRVDCPPEIVLFMLRQA